MIKINLDDLFWDIYHEGVSNSERKTGISDIDKYKNILKNGLNNLISETLDIKDNNIAELLNKIERL